MRGDGDGWVECGRGHRHWGRLGAAGLLLRAVDDEGVVRVLAQHRAPWSHDGDTWGIPGGARDSHEDDTTAALREAVEESQVDTAVVRVRETSRDDHGGWSYTTVLADTARPLPAVPCQESTELRWVPERELETLPLHPGFARSWPALRAEPVTLVVDGANVVGSRPDGWWRDRAGAARRLRTGLAGLRATVTRAADDRRIIVRRVVLVVEGAARAAAGDVVDAIDSRDSRDAAWVHTLAAPSDGDAAIVAAAAAETGVIVVTADRELRSRLPAGTASTGPRWLLARLDQLG